MIPQDVFMIRNPSTDSCWKAGSGSAVHSVKCDENDDKQFWTMRFNGTLIGAAEGAKCLDGALGDLPKNWETILREKKEKLEHKLIVYPCDEENVNQVSGRMLKSSVVTPWTVS